MNENKRVLSLQHTIGVTVHKDPGFQFANERLQQFQCPKIYSIKPGFNESLLGIQESFEKVQKPT